MFYASWKHTDCCSSGVEPESWGSPARVWRGCKSVGTAAPELIHVYSSWSGFRNVWPCPSLCLAPSLLASEHSGANSCLAPGNRDRSPAWSGGKPLTRLTLVCFLRPYTWIVICSSPVSPVAVASFHDTLPVARGPRWDIAVCRVMRQEASGPLSL